MSSREVEVKFRAADLPALSAQLRKLGFRRKTHRTHEMNTLYDLPGQPLRRRGELLRLRKFGPEWVLTHKAKGSRGRHKTRVETETRVENGREMEAILRALGFDPSFHYEKFRTEWNDGNGCVVLDETPIGNFAEIEGPPRWIDQTARALGVAPDRYITQNYASLFLDWKSQTGSRAQEMTFEALRKEGANRKR
ncbi:MAG: adenylate cyclase [Acidobacteria bacterium]|nr:MAG: adenylate cyclase [Acidobacteriota bacterium]PYY08048.1 MAG: adenylate cyclase [Acidobacteriota bacterium]